MSCARTLKYAKRLALIAPEALAATKLAINRGADASGFPQCPAGRADLVAPLYAATTEVGGHFEEIRSTDGLQDSAEVAARPVRGGWRWALKRAQFAAFGAQRLFPSRRESYLLPHAHFRASEEGIHHGVSAHS